LLDAVKIGRSVRIKTADVDAFFEAHRTQLAVLARQASRPGHAVKARTTPPGDR
jgi:hypothetical protein